MPERVINHLYTKIIGEGKPLLFISGLSADHQAWLPITPFLSPLFQCILFDSRGVGQSAIPNDGDCTISKMVDDVFMLLNELNIEKVSLIGHSMGGYVAQEFSAKYPDKVEKIILLSTKSRSQATQKLHQQTTINMMNENVPRELIMKNNLCWLFSNDFLSKPQNIENYITLNMKKPLEASRKSYFYQVKATANFDTSAAAKQIKAPTLIIAGEQDMIATIQDAHELNHLIQDSQLYPIKNMGHMAHIEIPEILSHRIIDFLNPSD